MLPLSSCDASVASSLFDLSLAEEEPPGCAVTGFAVCTAGCDMSELGVGAGGARKVRMGARVRRALRCCCWTVRAEF